MTSIGETLRRERLKRNLELGQISQHLKISSRMLAAIEDEQFEKLPGGVFSRSFVRQYARYLELDEEDIASRLEQILSPAPIEPPEFAEPPAKSAAPLSIQVPPVEDWEAVGSRSFSWRSPLTALGLVVVAMLGCAGVYSWWLRSRRPTVAREQPVAASVRTPIATAAEIPAPQPVPPSEPQPDSSQASQSTPPPSNPETEDNPNAPVRVQMTAAEPVWVSVRSDGRYLFSGVLEANQSRVVDANAMVMLVIGNAGGVSILLNGKPIGAVGTKGQVRNVQLTSGGFEIVAPKLPASLDPL